MSKYGEAIAAMARAVETLSEARDAVRELSPALVVDDELAERIRRRLENAGAQVELDRRSLEAIAYREAEAEESTP